MAGRSSSPTSARSGTPFDSSAPASSSHPNDPSSLAGLLRALLREDALADAVRGTEEARAELSWERAAEAHEQLYEQTLAERRR